MSSPESKIAAPEWRSPLKSWRARERLSIPFISKEIRIRKSGSSVESKLKIKPGQPYSPARAIEDRNQIIASYLNSGYLNATLRIQATPLPGDNHRVAVNFIIDEGPQVHVAQVVYAGQHRSNTGLLKQAVNIRPEAEMSETKLLQADSDLYNLGVFDWADVSPRRPITDQTTEDVLVEVISSKRNSISYGIGFQSTPRSGSLSTGTLVLPGLPTVGLPKNFSILEKTIISPLGSISYSRLDLRGRAETFSVSALVSSLDQKVTLTYSVPTSSARNGAHCSAPPVKAQHRIRCFPRSLGRAPCSWRGIWTRLKRAKFSFDTRMCTQISITC